MMGCATLTEPTPIHHHSENIRPGRPGSPEPAFSGFYTDGESWLSIGSGPDSASLVSLTGQRIGFAVKVHGPYVSGHEGMSDFAALYDTVGVFWAELHWSDGEQEEYTSRRLERKL